MTESFEIRRVVVALDALCDNRSALAAGTELVARWRCSFAGVFIVDASLVNLGAMPGVRQVRLAGGGVQLLDAADLEADLAARERRARRAMAEAAGRLGTSYSFAVARGAFPAASAGLDADDLLVVEGTPQRYDDRGRFEARWRRVAAAVSNPMLLLRRRATAPGPVAVLCRDAPGTARAAAAAGRLAAERQVPLVVIVAQDAEADAEARLAVILERSHPSARFVRMGSGEPSAWRRTLAASRPALIVVPVAMPAECWSEVLDADVLLIN